MKLYILVGLLAVSVNADTNLTTLSARKISPGWTKCNGNNPLQMRCSEDCQNLEFCINGQVRIVSCLAQTGLPYCDSMTNSCTNEIDRCNNVRDFCPHEGIFPDLSNCQRFVNCDDGAVNIYQCDYETVWNYKTGTCEDRSEENVCQTYTSETGCSGANANIMVPHANPRWFVFCNFRRALLAECPGYNYTFDKKLGNCRFQCEHQNNIRNGFYADEWDSSIYYKCYNKNGTWITDTKRCPKDSYFDDYRKICVMASTTPTTTTRKTTPISTSTMTTTTERTTTYPAVRAFPLYPTQVYY